MKTIVRNFNRLSLYLLKDDVLVHASNTNITVGNPVQFIIGDLNDSNSTIYTVSDVPTDWIGEKYLYKNNEWSLNPDYAEPVDTSSERLA